MCSDCSAGHRLNITMGRNRIALCIFLCCALPVYASRSEAAKRFLQRISTSPRDAPIFPVTLTFAWDGPVNVVTDAELFWTFNNFVGRTSVEEVIAEGRKAVYFFQRQYGVDFSSVPDEVLLGRGNYTTYDGSVTLLTGVLDPAAFYRMVTFSGPNFAIKMNNFIAEGLWHVVINKDFASRGVVNAMLPKGTIGLYGNLGIRVDETAEEGVYLRKPLGPVLVLHIESVNVLAPPHPYSGAMIADHIIENEYFGKGLSRGALIPMVDSLDEVTPQTHFNGKIIASFPGSLPFPLLPEPKPPMMAYP